MRRLFLCLACVAASGGAAGYTDVVDATIVS